MEEDNKPANKPEDNKPTKGYGKHSVWYWVVIYLIIAVVVYGLIYLLFFYNNNGNSGLNY